MAKYSVTVSRTCTHEFEVEARNYKAARKKAEPLAYDTDWSGFEAGYSVDSVLKRR